jgi:hypothetical protein
MTSPYLARKPRTIDAALAEIAADRQRWQAPAEPLPPLKARDYLPSVAEAAVGVGTAAALVIAAVAWVTQ